MIQQKEKQKKKSWIFNNHSEKGLRDLSPREVLQTYDWVVEHILPSLKLTPKDIKPVGSFGKKTSYQISSDVDVAISIDAILKANPTWPKEFLLNNIEQTLNLLGYETKKIPGFNQLSFAMLCKFPSRWGLVQVDLMLSPNLEWSDFIYHSPDFTKDESQYKGVVRTLLLMAILSESTRNILNTDDDGNTIEVESKIVRMPHGIYSTTRSFKGKRGLLKKAKLLKEHDKLITNDLQESTNMILGEGYTPRDLNSFESILKIMHKSDFIHKEHLNLIFDKFEKGLEINDLEVPEELTSFNNYFI